MKENSNSLSKEIEDDELECTEGRLLMRLHKYRERKSSKLIKKKKLLALKKEGDIKCEGCGFSFKEVYGQYGEGFIECHHKKPLSEMKKLGDKTTIEDLSLICSNCHRMIHRSKPWLTIEKLKEKIRS